MSLNVEVRGGGHARYPALYESNSGAVFIVLDQRGPAVCVRSSVEFPKGWQPGDRQSVFDESRARRLVPGREVILSNES